MKLYSIIIILISTVCFSSCSLFDFLKDNEDKNNSLLSEEEIQQLSDLEHFISQNQSEYIVSSFERFDDFCYTLQEMPGVTQVEVAPSHSQIILNMKWGSQIFIPLYHLSEWQSVEDEIDINSSYKGTELSQQNAFVTSRSGLSEKKKFLMVVHPDFKKSKDSKDIQDSICELYSKNGYEVVKLDFDDFTLDFIKNELPSFDVSFIATHGVHGYKNDDNERGLEIGDAVKESTQNIVMTQKKYPDVKSEILSVGEKFKPNSLMMLAACNSLDNDRITDALKNRGLKAIVGFSGGVDDRNASLQMERLSDYMLKGYSLKEAYDMLGHWELKYWIHSIAKFYGEYGKSTLHIKGEIDMKISEKVPNPIPLQATLKWGFKGDVDLHCFTLQEHLYFQNPKIEGAYLDYDNTEGGLGSIENIYWDNLKAGMYAFKLHYYRAEGSGKCEVRIKAGSLDQTIRVYMSSQDQWIDILTIKIDEYGKISTTRASEPNNFIFPYLPPKKYKNN